MPPRKKYLVGPDDVGDSPTGLARMSGVRMTSNVPETLRHRIRAGDIIRRFQEHFRGERTLTDSQIRVGMFLVNKVVPDLKQLEITGNVDHRLMVDMSEAEIDARLREIQSRMAVLAGRIGSADAEEGAAEDALLLGDVCPAHDAELEAIEGTSRDLRGDGPGEIPGDRSAADPVPAAARQV